MEQECLIFSEQMKNLLKRKKELICQQDVHGSLGLSCTSPVTINFSSLEEQEDSLDFLDASIVGQKIKIDLADRKNMGDATKEEKSLHSQRAGNPMDHPGISDVAAECARLYKARMDDICSVKKVPSRQKGLGVYQGFARTEPSKHFDFCDRMKKDMDETFRSNLNAVVKKSCKTKYRFYLLETTDDVFFEETKAHLEAEGHTAVQPPEFFLAEDCSSPLLIILRNEDIAEHISEVPDLLKLKMSPGVQFAGIDEPDDVVNLTHQELFTQGGFIMFNRAVLETLSLCDMKNISEILQERSRSGKWKWILHYKDSRRWKENARLNTEANEKKLFLHWGQDAGILDVLPYHDCDLVSKDQPDYLVCLRRLQVQNVSSRYTVFITDTTDSALEKNGILTMTLNTFLTKSAGETFLV
ncbi:protein TASOR 2-like [Xenentodon cancila]